MRGAIDYASYKINYRVRFATRKTLAISVHPDGSVEIIAPEGSAQGEIEQRLRKRAGWVLRQQRYFDQFTPRTPQRRFLAGETHLYLGRQYRLKIESGAEERVRLKGGYFFVSTVGPPDTDGVRCLLSQWYREHADVKLSERYAVVTARFARNLYRVPTLMIRSMQRRWGSYSSNGRITLNVDLVRAPLHCIDYVIVHELAHAWHPHHGRAFFDLLSQMMPDWERRKSTLERLLS